MKNNWSEKDAKTITRRYAHAGVNSDRALRVYTSRLLGREPKLVLHGGGNTSVKTVMKDVMGDEMFRLQDRKGADMALGMTHEEIFATIASEVSSYKDLPMQWYQIQLKFRDEPRPKSGLLRVREFYMKDAYSFDIDEAGLDKSFDAYHDAYVQIFKHLSLPAVPVEASSGAMGGSGSN